MHTVYAMNIHYMVWLPQHIMRRCLAPKPNKKGEALLRFCFCADIISFIQVFLFLSFPCAHLPPEQLVCLCAISCSVCKPLDLIKKPTKILPRTQTNLF